MECPVCFEIPKTEIFQCMNGHSLCSKCQRQITNCPQCRVSFGQNKIRNYAMESVLNSLRFDCKYNSRGCSSKLARNETEEHEKNCFHSGTILKFCELLGFICNYRISTNAIGSAFQHFKNVHRFRVTDSTIFNLHLPISLSTDRASRGYCWEPLIVELGSFKVLVICYCKEKNFSMLCLQASTEQSNSKQNFIRAEIIVRASVPNANLDIKFSSPPILIKDSANALMYPLVRLPIDQLKTDYINNGVLTINSYFLWNTRRSKILRSSSNTNVVEDIVLAVIDNKLVTEKNETKKRKRNKSRAKTNFNTAQTEEIWDPIPSTITTDIRWRAVIVDNTNFYLVLINVLALIGLAIYYLTRTDPKMEKLETCPICPRVEYLSTFPWNILKRYGYKVVYEPR